MTHNTTDWQLIPLNDGSTGQAFMGVQQEERVFLKRNASPFTTMLAAEGIAPKLLWTQRTYSGDILTAQEWQDGHLLAKQDMDQAHVIQLIKRVHTTTHLLHILRRTNGSVFYPMDFIEEYYHELAPSLNSHRFFNDVVRFLEDILDEDFYQVDYVVCHGDLHHRNFLLAANQHLYLVDWEAVRIADPLSDITFLLCQYFTPSSWMEWFDRYNFQKDATFYKRTQWYSLINCLRLIKQYFNEGQHQKMNEIVLLLRSIYEDAVQQHRQRQLADKGDKTL
ncbi:phosphotransferase family protein [Aerococcaceae bacterium NML190073]|nr:phosphotransferase family protein [Aerococcaceae bacterium NML190073]MCW6674533.1 phosphotransferase family protein [Aerococcaceae bacterium NML171108]MCW6676539.1 phosphotransferase family protein [Aerococcaceae bacterium NML180378]MDO4775219.1 phosphotransferase family protein [Aerococcaceae bacterium]